MLCMFALGVAAGRGLPGEFAGVFLEVPVGPSVPMLARRTMTFALSSTGRPPPLPAVRSPLTMLRRRTGPNQCPAILGVTGPGTHAPPRITVET